MIKFTASPPGFSIRMPVAAKPSDLINFFSLCIILFRLDSRSNLPVIKKQNEMMKGV